MNKQNEYVSFETAKSAYKKGFDEYCNKYYIITPNKSKGKLCITHSNLNNSEWDSYRIKNSYYLSYTNISTTGKLVLPKALLETIQDQAAAIYMNTDSTSVSAELYWLELGYLYHQDQVNFGKDVLQNKINTQVLTRDQLLEIGIEIDEGIEQIEVLIIDIPNFEQVKRHFEDKSIWFNLRLFTFDTTSDLPLK